MPGAGGLRWRKLAIWVAAAEQALSMDDVWEGLCLFLETMCELQARDRGFNEFASIRLPENVCLASQQTRIHDPACASSNGRESRAAYDPTWDPRTSPSSSGPTAGSSRRPTGSPRTHGAATCT